MCKTDKKIKLCTCLVDGNINTIVHNKKSRRHKIDKSYKWTLARYIGLEKSNFDGFMILPSDKLNDDLTNETMVFALNHESCFDFEYQPNEGDNLMINSDKKEKKDFLSFIFQKGQWKSAIYNSFEHKVEKINHGKIVVESKINVHRF